MDPTAGTIPYPTEVESDLSAALAAHRGGRHKEAESVYRRVLSRQPDHPDALHLLGMLLQQTGRPDEALPLLERAAGLDPSAAAFRCNLGSLLGRLGRHADAVEYFREAIRLRPDYPEAWQNLGVALAHLDKLPEAADAHARAAALRPGYAEAYRHGAAALRKLGRPSRSVPLYRKALELHPKDPGLWHELATAYGDLGHYKQAAEAFGRAAELDPRSSTSHSDYLHLLHYDPAHSREHLLAEANRWAARHAEPLASFARPHDSDRSPDRPLRVGYVSADFREHPIARLMLPVLAHLDHSHFQTFCYSDTDKGDGLTERLKELADTWRDTHGVPDEKLAEQIREDRIDVLIDLGGHMGGNRLRLFAHRPAPVQATQFNYPDTTGMTAMGWRFSDPLSEPEGTTDRYSTERLYRLPRCAWCYDPGPEVPEVGPLPALINGFVTFASLNKPLKHTPQAARLWARILAAVPKSRLLLLGLGDERENAALAELYTAEGIAPDRLKFCPRHRRRQYLEQYNRADVALDPFPYNGGVTSCDGLFMGVPVVALEGNTYHSRQGLMLLKNVGLSRLVATTPEQYVSLAVRLANDLKALARIRAELRERMRRSPVMDGPAFARDLGDAYRAMWQEWCSRDSASAACPP